MLVIIVISIHAHDVPRGGKRRFSFGEGAVESAPNPRRRKGKRNVFCSYYNECLDQAVKRGWDFWDCSDCDYQTDRGAEPEFQQSANHDIAYYEIGKNT